MSRNFAVASSHRISTTTTPSYNAAHTQFALVTVTSLPGAGVYRTAIGMSSATGARQVALQLNGDTGPGTLCAVVGAARVNPSTSMIPVADGRWYLMGATKASGTKTVSFFMYDFTTGTWTEFDTSATTGARTASAVVPSVGSLGAASYWDGRIAAAFHGPTVLTSPTWRPLIGGRRYWQMWTEIINLAGDRTDRLYMDLTIGGTIADYSNPSYVWGTGTIPIPDGSSNPPGW